MTEPVAYYREDSNGMRIYYDRSMLPELDNNDIKVKPLYDKNSLQPRVKMTKKQHRQFENYKTNKNSFYHFWQSLLVDDVSLFKEISERDLMLAWLDDETIEIVPNMKWFVRSKEQYQPDMDQGISESGYLYLTQGNIYSIEYYEMDAFKDAAQQFDTKEEAELWTNPLTEAVQLPVEGE
ncbi:hypothetical protein [Leuconostoc mesenteroides]|uniref:hypothetical protein n=1 Tax=Leuconostoc mesenteroides TaxID=1245 RepID=UPI002362C941|nr:hypothetical protein [Leuconostoc mesenteroides]